MLSKQWVRGGTYTGALVALPVDAEPFALRAVAFLSCEICKPVAEEKVEQFMSWGVLTYTLHPEACGALLRSLFVVVVVVILLRRPKNRARLGRRRRLGRNGPILESRGSCDEDDRRGHDEDGGELHGGQRELSCEELAEL